ncbi:MAG: ABC transporter substrate-binding protein [Oscillospiraceae bacterium]|nr:ABC transporter substrate-binding protein [Oscillospiraceae bacterium]
MKKLMRKEKGVSGKLLLLLLVMMVTVMFIVACDDAETPTTDTPGTTDTTDVADTTDTDEPTEPTEPTEITDATEVTIWFMGASVEDDAAVIEAANARLAELGAGVTINPIWTGGWAMGDPAQVALDTGDNSIDIFWTGSWGLNFWTNASVGNFIRLDNPDNDLLARYGQDMYAAVPEALWDAFTTDGPLGFGIYGIPGYKDYAQMYAWDVNNTRLEELGFDFDELFDENGINYAVFFDPQFEAAMVAAKEMYGDTFFPLLIEPETFVRAASNADLDLTGLSAFHFSFDPSNPANPVDPTIGLNLENEDFLAVIDRLHHFWNQGFIDPRLAIPGESSTVLVETAIAGEYLFSQVVYAYGHTAAASDLRGIDARFPPMSRPLVSSVSAAGSGFAISVYSQNQEAAMRFMNAWYTDNQLAVILSEGVEGIHWNADADGLIVLDHDARAGYAPWRFGMGNIFVLTPRDTDGVGYFDRFQAYNAAGTGTSLLGFTFDSEPVGLEIASLQGVVDQFHQSLTVGAIDPATAVEEYLSALRANGIDVVLAELNAQLQAFYAAR